MGGGTTAGWRKETYNIRVAHLVLGCRAVFLGTLPSFGFRRQNGVRKHVTWGSPREHFTTKQVERKEKRAAFIFREIMVNGFIKNNVHSAGSREVGKHGKGGTKNLTSEGKKSRLSTDGLDNRRPLLEKGFYRGRELR